MPTSLAEKKLYLLAIVQDIVKMDHTPFPFLCAVTMVEYLKNLSGHGSNYRSFIREYFPAEYTTFKFRSGHEDLPDQMEYTLRNGLVHNFNLIPQDPPMRKAVCTDTKCRFWVLVKPSIVERGNIPHCPDHGEITVEAMSEGRERAILITHRSARERPHLRNIEKTANGTTVDAALFVLEDFCDDISAVIHKIFTETAGNAAMEKKINGRWQKAPPISWLGKAE